MVSLDSAITVLEDRSKLRGKCGVCNNLLSELDIVPCGSCEASAHSECREYNGGCATYGCTEMPKTVHQALQHVPPQDQPRAYQSLLRNLRQTILTHLPTFSRALGYTAPEDQEPTTIEYNGLLWEAKAPRNGAQKRLDNFDVALARVLKEGYAGFPTLQEDYGLFIDGLEGKLTKAQQPLYGDRTDSYCEWADTGVKLHNGLVTFYQRPRNIHFENNQWNHSAMTHSSERTFPAEGLQLGYACNAFKEIVRTHPELIEYMTGRTFAQLPRELQENGHMHFPAEGVFRPVARGGVGWYVIYGDGGRASRGVRTVVAKKTPEEIEVEEKNQKSLWS